MIERVYSMKFKDLYESIKHLRLLVYLDTPLGKYEYQFEDNKKYLSRFGDYEVKRIDIGGSRLIINLKVDEI